MAGQSRQQINEMSLRAVPAKAWMQWHVSTFWKETRTLLILPGKKTWKPALQSTLRHCSETPRGPAASPSLPRVDRPGCVPDRSNEWGMEKFAGAIFPARAGSAKQGHHSCLEMLNHEMLFRHWPSEGRGRERWTAEESNQDRVRGGDQGSRKPHGGYNQGLAARCQGPAARRQPNTPSDH